MTQIQNHPVAIAILAAGASSRMRGGDKLLERINGEPLLQRQARIALETGASVIVALPIDRPDRAAALAGLDVHMVTVRDAYLGMSQSLKTALARARALDLPSQAGFMVLPADMPEFTAEALVAFVQAFVHSPDMILRGTSARGKPGHPAIFPRDFWDALEETSGDEGGKAVLAAHAGRVKLFPLPGSMAITDLDTPEDWAQWRAKNPD